MKKKTRVSAVSDIVSDKAIGYWWDVLPEGAVLVKLKPNPGYAIFSTIDGQIFLVDLYSDLAYNSHIKEMEEEYMSI
jgi:hypothetical protein